MKENQITFSDIEYGNRKRITKWGNFLHPFYPSGKRGRPVKGIKTMLRMYLLLNWFNLSDEGVEDAIYDSYVFCKFMKTDLVNEQVPDATILLNFRHMIEETTLV